MPSKLDKKDKTPLNIMDALLGKNGKGLPFTIEEGRGGPGLRHGPWKYLQGQGQGGSENGEALYNLDADIGEQDNLIEEDPARAQAMREMLQRLIDAEEGIRNSS